MYEKLSKYLGKLSKLSLTVSSFALVGLIGIVDYLTGYELAFSIFYLIPICLSTWFVDRQTGILMSVVSALVWLISDLLAGHSYPHSAIPYWNAAVRLGFFLIVTHVLAVLWTSQEQKKELIVELQTTLAKVKLLEGIVPVCSFCKKIRGEDNQWYTMEGYVMSHSEAQFSHTFCPNCAKEHYPEYYNKLAEE